MKVFLAEYAQRLLLSLFVVAFGLYLLIATLTYTPFDPGWTHLSSDTQSVTNASGVAGAWIADLLYGFLGRAALLIPLVLLLEAIQLWWPHSFVTRPFRLAAQVFLIVAVAALCSLHVYEPADTLNNASGGILGYELGSRMLSVADIWLVTGFLVGLVVLMMTLAFGIQWSRTLEMLGRIPPALALLFARQSVETPLQQPELAYPDRDTDLPPAGHEDLDSTTPVEALPIVAAVMPVEASIPAATSEWAAEPVKSPPAEFGQAAVVCNDPPLQVVNELPDSTAQRISPAFDWQDQEVFHQLLQAVPTHPVADLTDNSQPDPFDLAFSSIDAAVSQPIVNDLPPSVDDIEPETETSVFAPDLADIITAVEPVQSPESQVIPESYEAESFEPELAIQQALDQNEDVQTLSTQAVTDVVSEPEPVTTPSAETLAPIQTISPVVAVVAVAPVAQPVATPLQEYSALDTEAHEPHTIKITTLDPVELQDFDAPLTDASGRPMSRSMQVAAHRATLSPLPSLDLLDLPDPDRKPSYTDEELARLSELLEIKLLEFNIKGMVIEAQPGPVVTRFEVELAPGVKASKVTGISKDLARSMSMASVRVVEVIPGKPYIGIEVPNQKREMVRLIELLRVPAYRDPTAMLSMAMGKDIAGRPVLADLAKAPHMLVAGTTGSGKSVAVNAMLLSMLLKYTPQQLRMILIDPKQLELANYGDIPHLLTPVVTDMKDAVNALNWCVGEMERRYKLMTLFKVRKIDEFNRKILEAEERGEDILDPLWKASDSAVQDRPPRLKTLPLIVIVADEFADMIMQIGKKAEELITRLAQKSRAAGIHLMLATQRPSVDVITGLIKANIPTRVALRVNSKIDSRTILDASGAEDMLGHGDMLFLGPGKIEPERVHGAFISDDEVNRICDAWRERGSPDYVDDILTPFDEDGGKSSGYADSGGGDGADSGRDPMFDQVVAFVLETKKVSASSIQRKFSLGYNRAARIVDQMEDAGIVSPMGSSGKREVMM